MSAIQSIQIPEPPRTQVFQDREPITPSGHINRFMLPRTEVEIGIAIFPSFVDPIQTKLWTPTQQLIIMSKDISATEWKASLFYSDSETEDLVGSFLAEFQIEVNRNNKVWLLDTVASIISLYKRQYNVELSEEQTKALRNLALRIAYDRLRIK